MDNVGPPEDVHFYNNREIDQISVSSTASSCGYPRRPDSGGPSLYMPMNKGGGHSPGSNSKVSVSVQIAMKDFPYIHNVNNIVYLHISFYTLYTISFYTRYQYNFVL